MYCNLYRNAMQLAGTRCNFTQAMQRSNIMYCNVVYCLEIQCNATRSFLAARGDSLVPFGETIVACSSYSGVVHSGNQFSSAWSHLKFRSYPQCFLGHWPIASWFEPWAHHWTAALATGFYTFVVTWFQVRPTSSGKLKFQRKYTGLFTLYKTQHHLASLYQKSCCCLMM